MDVVVFHRFLDYIYPQYTLYTHSLPSHSRPFPRQTRQTMNLGAIVGVAVGASVAVALSCYMGYALYPFWVSHHRPNDDLERPTLKRYTPKVRSSCLARSRPR